MLKFVIAPLVYAALALLAVAVTPAAASAQEVKAPDVSVESILDNRVGRFLGDGFRRQDDLLQIDEYRRTQPRPAYDDGGLFAPDFGGDTHRGRARRGNILNIFNLD